MISLLPPLDKKLVVMKQIEKLITILCFLFLFFLICFILVLLYVKVHIQNEINCQTIVFEGIKDDFEELGIQSFQEEINSVNLTLTNLHFFYQSDFYISDVLDRISNVLPPGIRLDDFSVTPAPSNGKIFFKITLSGFVFSREILFDLKNRLEKEPGFTNVYFPPSNWTKSKDINFYITFQVVDI